MMSSSFSTRNDPTVDEVIAATEQLRNNLAKQDVFSVIRNEREKATFSMMMKMDPDALTNIRKEFFARRDSVTLDEFMYIIQKHLVNKSGDDRFIMETAEQREFGINMFELFKDIDVNGDGQLEWQVSDLCRLSRCCVCINQHLIPCTRNSPRSLWRKPTC